MAISAALVKELRERTGSGMMECKKALEEAQGDIEQAVEIMRKAGHAKADKKATRVAAEGMVTVLASSDGKEALMLEVNSETDFVARDEHFQQFVKAVLAAGLSAKATRVEALLELTLPSGKIVEEARKELVAKVGENILLRRLSRCVAGQGETLASYVHGQRIGVVVTLKGDINIGKDVAMHIAASKPLAVDPKDVSLDHITKEKEIFSAQAAQSGKPPEIVEKMVEGRVKKFLAEITLLGQPFVKNPDQTVESYLKQNNAQVIAFTRFELGEGIERAESNFAQEVMAQIQES